MSTLPGGEAFPAGLAPVLALVEITSRGAGRVEALFLDEGFGTLGTNALARAWEELCRNAGDCRRRGGQAFRELVVISLADPIEVARTSSRTLRALSLDELAALDACLEDQSGVNSPIGK